MSKDKEPQPITMTVAEHLQAYQILYDTIMHSINQAMAIHMKKHSAKTTLPKEWVDRWVEKENEDPDAEGLPPLYDKKDTTGYKVWHSSSTGDPIKDPSKNLENN